MKEIFENFVRANIKDIFHVGLAIAVVLLAAMLAFISIWIAG